MTDTTQGNAHNQRRLRLFLIISLAANILLVGALAGSFATRAFWHHKMRVWGLVPIYGEMMFKGEGMGRELRDAFEAHRGEIRAEARQLKEAHKNLRNIIAADSLDKEKLKAAFADLRARRGRMEEKVQNILIEALATMPAEKRAWVAEHLPPFAPHGPGRRAFIKRLPPDEPHEDVFIPTPGEPDMHMPLPPPGD